MSERTNLQVTQSERGLRNSELETFLSTMKNEVMLLLWWDAEDVLYYELLEPKQIVNSALYSEKLRRLQQAVWEKRPVEGESRRTVVLLRYNERSHIAKNTRKVIQKLGWSVLAH